MCLALFAGMLWLCAAAPAAHAGHLADGKALVITQAGARTPAALEPIVIAMLKAAGWGTVVGVPIPRGANQALVNQAMQDHLGPAGGDHEKLLWYMGHGRRLGADGNGDETVDHRDEKIAIIRLDDDFPGWAAYAGTKFVVFNNCSAEGMWDGTDDSLPTNAHQFGSSPVGINSKHWDYSKVLLRGFIDTGADAVANGGNNDGDIQASELKAWAVAQYDPLPNQPDSKYYANGAQPGLNAFVVGHEVAAAAAPAIPANGKLAGADEEESEHEEADCQEEEGVPFIGWPHVLGLALLVIVVGRRVATTAGAQGMPGL